MDVNDINSTTQSNAASCVNPSSETTECWSAIDNLLHLVNCDLVIFLLYEKNQGTGNSAINYEAPLAQRWARYSGPEHSECIQVGTLPIPNEIINNESIEEVCSINLRNGGSNETFIYPLHDLGCIRIVFLDSEPLDKNTLSRRQMTIDQVFPHLTSCFSVWLANRQKSIKGKQLTRREMEVLYWIKEGKSTWESAQILEITERTVKYHLKNIFRKLNANNRTQAVSRAIEHGLF